MPKVVDDSQRLVDRLESVKDRATSEFGSLSGMAKIKAVQVLGSNASKVKDTAAFLK